MKWLTIILMLLTFSVNARETKSKEAKKIYRNRLTLVYSSAPTANARCGYGNGGVRCKTDRELHVGVQAMRDIYYGKNMNVHAMIQVLSNRQISFGFGIGF